VSHLFEENRPEPAWPEPAGDTFFQDAGDSFPVQPEPDGRRPPASRGRGGPPPGPRYRDAPVPAGPLLTPQRLLAIVVAAVAVLALAVFVPRILTAARTDTVTGVVARGSGAASWQVSLVIPEQAPATSFSGQDAESAKVGLPVTISVPAAGLSGVAGAITELMARTSSEGGGFTAIVQPRGGTKIVPAAGKTADVTLGS
jgi:hypothetical protein